MENGVWLSEPDRSLVTGKMGEGGKEESPTEFTDVGTLTFLRGAGRTERCLPAVLIGFVKNAAGCEGPGEIDHAEPGIAGA